MHLLFWTALAWAAPTLDLVGSCPGPTDILVTGATPSGTLVLLSSPQSAASQLPDGPCAGVDNALVNPTQRQELTLGPSGWAVLSLNLPAGACSQWLEVLDVETCTLSPARPISNPDLDGDGYAAVERGGHDCDDANPDIHPGQAEVFGNDLDDDCDPTTEDQIVCEFKPDPALAVGEPPALAGVTAHHNQWRALVGVAPVRWDPRLAASAQAWADKCTFAHSTDRSNVAGYPYVGENVAWASPASAYPDPLQLVEGWANERAQYVHGALISTDTLASSGHYTQMVWQGTTAIGCGFQTCGNASYLVCHYGPGGNYVSQLPYPSATGPCLDQDGDDVLQGQDPDDTNASLR